MSGPEKKATLAGAVGLLAAPVFMFPLAVIAVARLIWYATGSEWRADAIAITAGAFALLGCAVGFGLLAGYLESHS